MHVFEHHLCNHLAFSSAWLPPNPWIYRTTPYQHEQTASCLAWMQRCPSL